MWPLVRALLASALVCGCSVLRQEPLTVPAQDTARCGDDSLTAAARVWAPRNIDGVEPLYAVIHSHSDGAASRLVGAKLRLRSAEGLTTESLTHALYCRAATETLQGDDAGPLSWRSSQRIDIAYEDDGFVVRLEGRDFRQARAILSRARAFARKP